MSEICPGDDEVGTRGTADHGIVDGGGWTWRWWHVVGAGAGLGVLIALADLASAWVVVILPLAVAAMVTYNHLIRSALDPGTAVPENVHHEQHRDGEEEPTS